LEADLGYRAETESGNPPVAGVGEAIHEPGVGEAMDEGAHRVRGQPQLGGHIVDANPRTPVDQAKDLQLRLGERIRVHAGAHPPVEAAAQPAGSPSQPARERIEVGRGGNGGREVGVGRGGGHDLSISILSETDMTASSASAPAPWGHRHRIRGVVPGQCRVGDEIVTYRLRAWGCSRLALMAAMQSGASRRTPIAVPAVRRRSAPKAPVAPAHPATDAATPQQVALDLFEELNPIVERATARAMALTKLH